MPTGLPVALEPKPREPRNRSLIDNVQTALLLRMECGHDNLGVTLDTGHVLAGGQGIGPSIALAMHYKALYNLHTNDNYGVWDDDMIVGSVRLNEALETFYLLNKYGYEGYISVDNLPLPRKRYRRGGGKHPLHAGLYSCSGKAGRPED